MFSLPSTKTSGALAVAKRGCSAQICIVWVPLTRACSSPEETLSKYRTYALRSSTCWWPRTFQVHTFYDGIVGNEQSTSAMDVSLQFLRGNTFQLSHKGHMLFALAQADDHGHWRSIPSMAIWFGVSSQSLGSNADQTRTCPHVITSSRGQGCTTDVVYRRDQDQSYLGLLDQVSRSPIDAIRACI